MRPIEAPSARRSAGSARPARQRARSRSAEGVATRGLGRRRGGEAHGPSAGPRGLTAARAGRRSRHGHTLGCAPRSGQLRGRAARMAVGGPVTRRERAVAVPYGRLAVVSALMLGSARNQGWRAARRGHGDDAAAWFVSIGRVWRAPGASGPQVPMSPDLMIDEIKTPDALPCVSRLHTHSQPHHSEDTVPTSPNYSRPAAHRSRKPRTTRPRAGRVGPRKNAGCLGWGGSKRDTGAPDRPTRHQGGPPPDRPTGCSVLPRSWKPPSINPPEGRAKPLPPGAPCRADQTAPRAQISQQPPARKPNCLGSVSSEKN